jgi:DNA-binding transcriptional LysR family regulator
MNNLKVGHLSVGASNVFAAYALPEIITEYKNKYPEVDVRLTEGNTAALEEMLSQNSLNMVIDNNHYDSALYDRELYSKEMILLAIPKKFDICREIQEYSISEEALRTGAYLSSEFPTVPLEKLKDIPFIMLAPGNDTRIRGDKLCFEAGFRPKIILELNQQATAYMTASTEMGATFVSDILAAGLPIQSTFLYFKLSGDVARRNVYFYYKKKKV